MTDDTLRDLADDAVSIKANIEDLRARIHGPGVMANRSRQDHQRANQAYALLLAAALLMEEVSGRIDLIVHSQPQPDLDLLTQLINEDENVAFPECPQCGAPPGQAHDPTCDHPSQAWGGES